MCSTGRALQGFACFSQRFTPVFCGPEHLLLPINDKSPVECYPF